MRLETLFLKESKVVQNSQNNVFFTSGYNFFDFEFDIWNHYYERNQNWRKMAKTMYFCLFGIACG